MSLIDQLRASRPDLEELKDLTDSDLVSMYSQVTGASLDLSAMDLGLDPQDYIQNKSRGEDLVNQGILGLGDIVGGVAGFLDIPVAGATGYAPLSSAVDWAADATGLSDYGRRLELTMSPQSQQTNAAWDKTWNDEEMGAWDKAKNLAGVVWDDPAYALEFAARSAPTLIPAFGAAKLLGMGAKAMEAAGLTRTAAAARPLIPGMAEGGVAAGYQMNNLLGEDVDPREAAGYSALTGIGTGILGGVTGALGARAGLTDPHRLIAGYRLPGEAPALPYYKRIPGGMALEAGQEALQSPWEQAMTNVATGEEWDQGLARSAVEGAIGGGIIGAPFNVFRGREVDLLKTQDAPEAEPLDPTKGLDTTRFNAPSDVPSIRNQVGLNTAEGLSNWAGVQGPGGTSGYAGALAASYNEPSGHRVADKVTGVERELSTGDWLYYQATGQLPPTTDPAKVEGKPKPIEGAAPELQRLLDVARNLPIAADPTKVKPGEVTANGHNQKGKPSTKAVEWATTLSGLKTVAEVDKAVEKGTRSTAGYWQWVMPMALARIQEINAEQAQTLAQQAKQNDTVDGPGVPVTPTIAQNAQPTEGVVPPTPTTSSVAQDEVDEEFAREMPPITPEQHDRAIANGIRSTSDLDAAHRTGELDVPTPPPSPITSEIPTNALSGQTTPQAGQETGTTAPDATTEPGVTEAPKVPKTRQKIIVDENVLGWQNAFNAAVDRVAGVRNLSDKAKTTFSELMQRYYQVGRFSTYAGVKPPSYDAMAARLRRDGHEVSHTQVSKYISDFQDGYAAAMGQEGQPVTFEKPDENTWGYALDDGNYLGKRDIGATAASEDYVDLQDSRANDTEVDIAPDGEAALPEQAAPVNQFGEMADDATIDDELGYQTGSVGGVNEFVSGGRGGAEGVSARPRVVKYFAKRHLFATNQARAARGESPLTEAEAKAELGKLSDEVLGRYLDRLRKAAVSDARLADPKDAKPKLTAAYQGLQDDMAALGAGALRATKNNRVVEELEEPDTGAATPGAVVAWQQATQSIPNAPALGTLSVDLAGTWEEAYNLAIGLPDVHRAPWLRNVARKIISEQNTQSKRGDANVTATQPRTGDAVSTGDSQNDAGRATESGDAQSELAGRRGAAPEPDIVIGAKDASNVAITTRKKRRVAPPAEPQVQQGLGEGVAENPTTEQALRDTIASLLGKGHNWRIHVYATPEAARAASRAKSEAGNAYGWAESDQEIGNAYGWVESDQNGVKHAYFIANRIEAGTELGKFLHEVGAHIGLENILSPALYQNLVGQLRKWVALNNDSLESRLAKAALARVEYAQAENTRTRGEGLDQVEQDSELVAYFLEEAIKAGIDPTATKANSPLGTWFLRLWTAFKRALRKLRIENLDQLQPQHVVDLAYGAARLELNTYWHGTAASFRKFNHDYMGSGEGAQAYSWGSYLAQRFSTGEWYFEADVRRRTPSAREPKKPPTLLVDGVPWRDFVKTLGEDEADVAYQVLNSVEHHAFDPYNIRKTFANTIAEEKMFLAAQKHSWTDKKLAWLNANEARLTLRDNNPKAPEGSLMRVDVNATPDEIMSWDLPLNEQPQKVQEVIRQHFGEDLINDEDLSTMTGEELYKRVLANNKWSDPEMWTYVSSQDMATDGKGVSEWFDSLGIKGMEHFDGTSRSKYQRWKQRNKNRVTFEDGSFINPRSLEERSAASHLHAYSDKPTNEAIQAALDAVTRVYAWEGEEERAFNARVAEVLKRWKEKGIRMERVPRPNLTTNLVVFNDKNLYRVARAPGGDTTPGKVQYGIAAPSHITAAKEAVHNVLSDTYTGTNRGLLGWMGINNIAERFGETLPILKSIEKTFNEMSHQAKLWLDRGDQIERLWSMLTPKQTELVSFIAGNATILQFDPSKDQANTPEKQEVAQKWKELQALDGANPKVKGTTTLLAAVQHYRDVHKESLAYLEGVLKQAQAAGASTHAIESVRDTIKALRKKQTHFWLPLHRFGDFHSVAMSPTLFALHQRHQQHLNDVHANKANPAAWSKADDKLFRQLRKDPKHYESMGHESERAARRRATHWQGKGWQATSNVNRYTSDMARVHLKPEIEAFEKMLAHTKLDAKVANKLVDSYTDLLIEALPENHILKRQLDREGIAGWDPDMKRAFAKTAQSQAFAMSRLLHARKLGEQLGQLERQGDSFQPHATLARDLHAELIKQQELAMTRSEDPYWVRFATGFNYMSMLGGSPFFWALQLAQVPTITLPYLIGRNNANVTDTMGKLATAWGQAKDFVKWSVEDNEWRAELDFSRAVKGVTPEELAALKEMDEAGRFVFTIGQDLGAAAEGRNTKTARFIRSINTPTHTTELINRVSTGLAAYRISRKNGNAPKGAIEFALRTIDNTQVNMDPVMGARNLKTLFGRQGTQPFAKIIFQFWKFQQGMAYTTLTTMKDALTHPDPALRKQARDSAIGLTVSLMATSGIFGLPFVGTGMMLLSFLASLDGDDDEDDDVERLVKNWIKESPLPNVVADTLNKGFLSAILPTDAAPYLAPRFGMGTLMNPLGYARFDDAERGEDVVKELMFRVLGGPTGSSAAAFWDGIQAGLDGDYAKATEKMVPLKLMRDLARTYTLADQGVSTGKGEERIDPNDMSVMSWIWQAMGVTPMKKAMYHEGQAGVQSLKTAVTGEREKLLARHAQARLKGEDVSEITRNILRFNQKHPHARIKAENLRQAFSRRRDNQRKLTDTGILADRQNRPYLGNAAWTQ